MQSWDIVGEVALHAIGDFPQLGVLFWGSHTKDYGVLGSILGSPDFFRKIQFPKSLQRPVEVLRVAFHGLCLSRLRRGPTPMRRNAECLKRPCVLLRFLICKNSKYVCKVWELLNHCPYRILSRRCWLSLYVPREVPEVPSVWQILFEGVGLL